MPGTFHSGIVFCQVVSNLFFRNASVRVVGGVKTTTGAIRILQNWEYGYFRNGNTAHPGIQVFHILHSNDILTKFEERQNWTE